MTVPFSISLTIEGTSDLLFHRWSCESIEEKGSAGKNTKTKKTDDVESYVYRDTAGHICIPGCYIACAVSEAGRYYPDPRSPRKSAKDLIRATVICENTLSPVLVGGKPAKEWQYLDKRRVTIQRNGITRIRPAFEEGWKCDFTLTSMAPEYISPEFLRTLVDCAGKFIGVADFRPSHGRFVVSKWETVRLAA
jgi:hypothetical protein